MAYLFNKLRLTQSEGQGIPTIIRTMREEGCPDPIFEIEEQSVTCILPAHFSVL
jgi:predicted HTH transcriptional regulator